MRARPPTWLPAAVGVVAVPARPRGCAAREVAAPTSTSTRGDDLAVEEGTSTEPAATTTPSWSSNGAVAGLGTGALGGIADLQAYLSGDLYVDIIVLTGVGITTDQELVEWLGGELVTDDGFTYVSTSNSWGEALLVARSPGRPVGRRSGDRVELRRGRRRRRRRGPAQPDRRLIGAFSPG